MHENYCEGGTMSGSREVRAPRGTELTCKNWLIEAPYRMIQNNLDPEVAERPEALVVNRVFTVADAPATTLLCPMYAPTFF